MNRSILIVICDFLLLSLLAFSTIDVDKVADPTSTRSLQADSGTNQPEKKQDLTAVMRMALEEEKKNQERLAGELAKVQQTLGERDRQAADYAQQIQSRDQQAAVLKEEQANAQQRLAAAQNKLLALSRQLEVSSKQAAITAQKLTATENTLRTQTEQANSLQQQIEQLAKSNQTSQAEQQRLAAQLQGVEAEKRAAAEQIARLRDDVKAEREEKARLTEGVMALAQQSGNIAREIRENRALAPNTVFSEFLTNRLQAHFHASRAGFLGLDSNRDRKTGTVLVTDGTNTYALCHVEDTPLALRNPGAEWEALTGSLTHGGAEAAIRTLSFAWPDPRVVLIGVAGQDLGTLGGKVYRMSADPFKFQDAIVVGAVDGYYGECKFEIDEGAPHYVRLDRRFLKGLFGQFNPSAGDFVFSRTGEILGVMVNNTYCMMVRNFSTTETFQFGPDVRAQHTGDTLARLSLSVLRMPFKLQ